MGFEVPSNGTHSEENFTVAVYESHGKQEHTLFARALTRREPSRTTIVLLKQGWGRFKMAVRTQGKGAASRKTTQRSEKACSLHVHPLAILSPNLLL